MTPMSHLDLLNQAWPVRPEVLPLIGTHLRSGAAERDLAAIAEAEDAARESDAGANALRGISATGGIALLSLRGMITPRGTFLQLMFGGGGGLQRFRAGLREAVGNPDVSAIVIDVDSPGGASSLLTETAAEIREARKEKTVIAVANVQAASAAYWLASQASEVVVTPSGAVGSIGVWTLHADFSEMDKAMGVDFTLISAGEHKVEGNEFEPLSEEAREQIQAEVDEVHSMFLSDVAKGRGVTAAKVRADFGRGRMLSAKKAVAAGLADRVDTIENVLSKLARGRGGGRRAEDSAPAPAAVEEPTTSTHQHDPEQLAAIRDRLDQTNESLKED